MGKLKKYAETSAIMEVRVKFGKEIFRFNLTEELEISTDRINSEIQDQPSSYSFLSMLQVRLSHLVNVAEKDMEAEYSKVYNRYKKRVNEDTGRIYDKEYTEHIANANPLYQEKKQKWLDLKEKLGIINTCVKGFEQRGYLIQTLSANIRKES